MAVTNLTYSSATMTTPVAW